MWRSLIDSRAGVAFDRKVRNIIKAEPRLQCFQEFHECDVLTPDRRMVLARW